MGDLIHLINVKQNKHGELQPIKYENCPIYQKEGIKAICEDENIICIGIEDGNCIKEIRKQEFLLQCNYCKVVIE